MSELIPVEREWLVFVDSITSLVAYRKDLSRETIEDLKNISAAARALYQGRVPFTYYPSPENPS